MEQTEFIMPGHPRNPLVATLLIDPSAQHYFNELRARHFPEKLNHLKAHLTLFHALPDEPWIIRGFQELAEKQQQFVVTAQAIMSLGGGTAFKITSPELPLLHQKLQKKWFEFLSNQDRQKRNFHVTVQNKVESRVAKELQENLSKTFEPFSFGALGFQLWRYQYGPWEYLTKFEFSKDHSG